MSRDGGVDKQEKKRKEKKRKERLLWVSNAHAYDPQKPPRIAQPSQAQKPKTKHKKTKTTNHDLLLSEVHRQEDKIQTV
jgi:hypothetical protein